MRETRLTVLGRVQQKEAVEPRRGLMFRSPAIQEPVLIYKQTRAFVKFPDRDTIGPEPFFSLARPANGVSGVKRTTRLFRFDARQSASSFSTRKIPPARDSVFLPRHQRPGCRPFNLPAYPLSL
jgi:hypothetical protein